MHQPPVLTLDEDRRSHPRIAVERPCKIHDPRSGKYHAGTVLDLSAGGMMISINRDLSLMPGDLLYVGVAQKRRQVLLRTDEMMRTRVARFVGGPSGGWIIGVELLDQAAVSHTILHRAA